MTPISHREWVALRRIDRRLGREARPTLDGGCLEHPFVAAVRVLRGIGPLCGPCIAEQERAPVPGQRPVLRCGCRNAGRYCPDALALYQRSRIAHERLLDTTEADQDRRRRLAVAHGQMLLALRRHTEGI